MISPRSIPPRPPEEDSRTLVIDLAAALERIGGDRQLYRELALIFIEDSPRLLEALRGSLAQRDGDQAERSAHGLKGIAANVGGIRVERVAVVVEDAARSGQFEIADIGFQSLLAELERLIGGLRALLADVDESSETAGAGE